MADDRERGHEALREYVGIHDSQKLKCIRLWTTGKLEYRPSTVTFTNGKIVKTGIRDESVPMAVLALPAPHQDGIDCSTFTKKDAGACIEHVEATHPWLRNRIKDLPPRAEANPEEVFKYDCCNGFWRSRIFELVRDSQVRLTTGTDPRADAAVKKAEKKAEKKVGKGAAKKPPKVEKRAAAAPSATPSQADSDSDDDLSSTPSPCAPPPQKKLKADSATEHLETPSNVAVGRRVGGIRDFLEPKQCASTPAPSAAPLDSEEESEDSVAQAVHAVPVGQPVGKAAKQCFPALTTAQQLESGCGNNAYLVKYARDNYGDKRGGIPTRQVIAWYRKHPDQLPAHYKGKDFGSEPDDLQVCHIISVAKGGSNWIYNYGIYPRRVNVHYGKYMPKEWSQYIGPQVESMADTFASWAAKKLAASVTFGAFDPVSDQFLAKGR